MDRLLGAIRHEDLIGIGRDPEAGEIRGDRHAQPRPAERVVAHLAEQCRDILAKRRFDGRADGGPRREGTDRQLDRSRVVRWSEAACPHDAAADPNGPFGVRVAGRCRGEVVEVGAACRHARPASLPAPCETGQTKAVVRSDDRRPAECQLPGQLALRGKAGARWEQPDLDRARQGVGQLLVEGLRTARPRTDQLDQPGGRDHLLPFQSTLDRLAIWHLVHRCQYRTRPVHCQEWTHESRSNGPERMGR